MVKIILKFETSAKRNTWFLSNVEHDPVGHVNPSLMTKTKDSYKQSLKTAMTY